MKARQQHNAEEN